MNPRRLRDGKDQLAGWLISGADADMPPPDAEARLVRALAVTAMTAGSASAVPSLLTTSHIVPSSVAAKSVAGIAMAWAALGGIAGVGVLAVTSLASTPRAITLSHSNNQAIGESQESAPPSNSLEHVSTATSAIPQTTRAPWSAPGDERGATLSQFGSAPLILAPRRTLAGHTDAANGKTSGSEEITPRATPPLTADQLPIEVRFIEEARRSLARGDSGDALRWVNGYLTQFPAGVLEPEAHLLRIDALLGSGGTHAAASEIVDFLARYPRSPQRCRLFSALQAIESVIPMVADHRRLAAVASSRCDPPVDTKR